MLKRLTNSALAGCVMLLITAVAVPSPQEKKEKRPKDQQEYELINQIFYKEKDPAKKLQLLDQWKQKYAETAFSEERLRLYMDSFQKTNQREKAIASAKELLAMVPGDFSAYYTMTTLTPLLGGKGFEDGQKAAKALTGGGIDKQFQASNKPANVSAVQWNDAKKQAQISAHQTLGWIAMQRKDNTGAETEFQKVLGLSPNSAQVSYWLGNVVIQQGDPNKNELALFSFARAAAYDGPGALTPEGRQQVNAYLTKVYAKYAGSEEGLDDLKALAKMNALPPADLKIESADVRAFKAEQKSRKESPLLWVFLDLKTNLVGSTGDSVWSDLNGKLTPKMRLFVVSANPPNRPQTINLSSKQGGPVEVVLNLENRLRTGVGSGRQITFEGVASGLTKAPFRLTLKDGKVL